jgi:hypothetical protein
LHRVEDVLQVAILDDIRFARKLDLGGGYVAVTQELLNGADVVAGFEEVGREAVAEGVRRFTRAWPPLSGGGFAVRP